jgi:O-antigen/teichoic acid export membrane protein
VAFQLSSLPVTKINQLIREVAFPAYSHIQNDRERVKAYFLKNIQYISLILFPVLVGLYLVAADFYSVFLGEKWLSGVILFKVLCISCIFKAVFSQHAPILNAIGRPDINVKYSLLLACFMPLAFVLLLKQGIIWVAIAWVTIYPVLGLYTVYHTIKILNLNVALYIRQFTAPIVSCLIMVLVVGLFKQLFTTTALIRLISTSIVGFLTYFLSIYLIFNKTGKDLSSLIRLFLGRQAPKLDALNPEQ